MSDRPVLSVTYKRGDTTYSVISVWPGRFAGTYSVSRDKGSEKYPALSIIDVLKAFASGDGFIDVRVNGTENSGQSGGFGGGGRDDFADDAPF